MDEVRLISRVRPARRDRRMTQSDLAAAVGVSRQTIVAVEGDNYAPSVVLALKIAHALDAPFDILFALDGIETPRSDRGRQDDPNASTPRRDAAPSRT